MNIVLKPSGGNNIVIRPQAVAPYYPTGAVNAAHIDVYWRTIADDGSVSSWSKLGTFSPGASYAFPFVPMTDTNVELSTISYSSSGVPSARNPNEGVRTTVAVQRETNIPVVAQVGDATADNVSIGISNYGQYARKRRIRIAESLSMGALVSPIVEDFDAGVDTLPAIVDILREASFTPLFAWLGNDPVSNGFTKTGSGVVMAATPGWNIDTLTLDVATYYTKSSWPGSAFAAGFTLDFLTPTVNSSDASGPSKNACIAVDDGTHRYEITFDATNLKLNGGTSHAHTGLRIRLVIASGGAHADLWIGVTKVETATASGATVSSGLTFGDTVTTDDSNTTWWDLNYILEPVPVKLTQTIYVAVSHSSGTVYTAESSILNLTFAADAIVTNTAVSGGSSGDLDPTPRYGILPGL